MSRSPFLVLVLVACARRPEELAAASGHDVPALVVESSPERVVLLTKERKLVTLEEAPGTNVRLGDRSLPGIDALMEGDRVRASFEAGRVDAIRVEESTTFYNQRTVQRATHLRERLPAWADTMRSPGGGIGSSRWVGTWDYTPPVWRVGPPPKNAVTGKPTPADQRPSF